MLEILSGALFSDNSRPRHPKKTDNKTPGWSSVFLSTANSFPGHDTGQALFETFIQGNGVMVWACERGFRRFWVFWLGLQKQWFND